MITLALTRRSLLPPSSSPSADIGDLFPHLLTPHLITLDLSCNKKVRGDVKVFETARLDLLVDLFLHRTGVTGDYKSFRSGIATGLPRLTICTLMETEVVGDLSFLPGANDRSTLDVHTVVEPACVTACRSSNGL